MRTHNQTKMHFTGQTIIVCDPCYIFDYTQPELEVAWQEACSQWYPDYGRGKPADHADAGVMEYNGAKVLYTRTKYGDGEYRLGFNYSGNSNGKRIPVDSGTICVVTLEDALKINPSFDYNSYTMLEGFHGMVGATGEGFHGALTVNTADDEEENEDDYYDDSDDAMEA